MSAQRESRTVRLGAPVLVAAVPAWGISALGLVAGVVGGAVAIGASGWLVVAVVLAVAAAVVPRGPFAALVVVQLSVATVFAGAGVTLGRVAVLLLVAHLVLVVGTLTGWVPWTARVELHALAPTGVRFVLLQVVLQLAGLGVVLLAGGGPSGSAVGIWFGVLAVVGLLVLVLGVLVPTLRDRSGDRDASMLDG